MKVTSLAIKNIGIITDTVVKFDKPLILFYGEIRQGKTTLLNAVRWVCGGAFPSDIIKHGAKEASVELGFDGGCIRREWYVSKDGSTKAREVQYVLAGKPQDNPVAKIKMFLNPFLLNQDHLRNMTELERKRYFAELFAVDTTALDTELFNKDKEASSLRSELKGFGELDLTKVEAIDVETVKAVRQKILDDFATSKVHWQGELTRINAEHETAVAKTDQDNQQVTEYNSTVTRSTDKLASINEEITQLEQRLTKLNGDKSTVVDWLKEHPTKPLIARPAAPDTTELKKSLLNTPDTSVHDQKISEAAANQVRVEQYNKNVERAGQKKAKEKELSALEKRMREIKVEKIAKLKSVSETCGIPELEFDEDGNFKYQGTTAGMLSTSQVMKLSSELSALYPEGMGLELLDRGESLGRSIFDYIELAKREDKTILATIVGQRPSATPPEVGVFVVSDGKVIPDEVKP